MLHYDGPRTEEEMRARARDLHRKTFPERKPWVAGVLARMPAIAEVKSPTPVAPPNPPAEEPVPKIQLNECIFALHKSGRNSEQIAALLGVREAQVVQRLKGLLQWRDVGDVVSDLGAIPVNPRPTLKSIADAVGAAFYVSIEDIFSRRRPRQICDARHSIYRIARDLTLLSLPQIGEWLGRRDHTAVMHGIGRTKELFPELRLDPDSSVEHAARVMATLYRVGGANEPVEGNVPPLPLSEGERRHRSRLAKRRKLIPLYGVLDDEPEQARLAPGARPSLPALRPVAAEAGE